MTPTETGTRTRNPRARRFQAVPALALTVAPAPPGPAGPVAAPEATEASAIRLVRVPEALDRDVVDDPMDPDDLWDDFVRVPVPVYQALTGS